MEPDQLVTDSSVESITSTTTIDENSTDQTSVAAGRSYECNFCKRGFTNAQALGGHMNIHRKYKAKLKDSSSLPPNAAAAAATATTGYPFLNSPQMKNKPLPLFVERLSDSRNFHQENTTVDPPSSVPELDLELRLGHIQSPQNKITPTRKFF